MIFLRKTFIVICCLFLIQVHSNQCQAMTSKVITFDATVCVPGNNNLSKRHFTLDVGHTTEMSLSMDRRNISMLKGGHFASKFTRFEHNGHIYFAAMVHGNIRIGVVVPKDLMSRVVRNRSYMSCYGADWVQVVWFNQDKKQGKTKTLFGPNITLRDILFNIQNLGYSNPQYSYIKEGHSHNSFYLADFGVPVSFIFNNNTCHTIYPRVGISEEEESFLVKQVGNLINFREFIEILAQGRSALTANTR